MDIYRLGKLKLFRKKKGQDLRAQSVYDLQRFRALYLGATQSRGLAPPPAFDKCVYKAISTQSNLVLMDFRGQDVSDNQLLALVETLLEIPILSSLDLRDNLITEEGGLSILELLRHQLISAKANSAGPSLEYTRLITKVDLRGNNVSEPTLQTIRQYTAMLAREDKRLQIKSILNQLDYNASGSLDENEVRIALKLASGVEPTKKDVGSIMEQLGLLSWQLSNGPSPSQKQTSEASLRAALENILLARFARSPAKKDMEGMPPIESLAQIRHAELTMPSNYNAEDPSDDDDQVPPMVAAARRSSVRLASSLSSLSSHVSSESTISPDDVEMPPVDLESPPTSGPPSPMAAARPPPIVIPAHESLSPMPSQVVSPVASPVAAERYHSSDAPVVLHMISPLLSPVSTPPISPTMAPQAEGLPMADAMPATTTSIVPPPFLQVTTEAPQIPVVATSLSPTVVEAPTPPPLDVAAGLPPTAESQAYPGEHPRPDATSIPAPALSPAASLSADDCTSPLEATPCTSPIAALVAPLSAPLLPTSLPPYAAIASTVAPPSLNRLQPVSERRVSLESLANGDDSDDDDPFELGAPEESRSLETAAACQSSTLEMTVVDDERCEEETSSEPATPYTCEQQPAMYQGYERVAAKLQHPQMPTTFQWASLFPDVPLTNVVALILCHNALESISFQDMQLRHLRVLDLSANKLHKLTPMDVQPLRQLEVLDLSFNAFRTIHGIEHLTHLKALNFAGNHIKAVKNLEFLEHLEILNLAQNEILTPQALRLLSLNKHLTHLNIDDNPVVSQGNHRHHSAHILNIIPTLRSLGCIHLAALILREKRKDKSVKLKDDAPSVVTAVDEADSPYWIAQACKNVGLVCDAPEEAPRTPSPKKVSRHEQRSRDELRAKSFAHHIKKEAPPPPPMPVKAKPKCSFAAQQKRAILLSTPKPSAVKPPPPPKAAPPPPKSIPVVSTLKGFLQPTQASIHSTLAAEREKSAKVKKPKSAMHKRLLRREEKLRQYLVATSPPKLTPPSPPPPRTTTVSLVLPPSPARNHTVPSLSSTPSSTPGLLADTSTEAFLQSIRFREFVTHVTEDHATALSALDILVTLCERSSLETAKLVDLKTNLDSMQILGHFYVEPSMQQVLDANPLEHDSIRQQLAELHDLKRAMASILSNVDWPAATKTGYVSPSTASLLRAACEALRTSTIGKLLTSPAPTSLDLLSPTSSSVGNPDPFSFAADGCAESHQEPAVAHNEDDDDVFFRDEPSTLVEEEGSSREAVFLGTTAVNDAVDDTLDTDATKNATGELLTDNASNADDTVVPETDDALDDGELDQVATAHDVASTEEYEEEEVADAEAVEDDEVEEAEEAEETEDEEAEDEEEEAEEEEAEEAEEFEEDEDVAVDEVAAEDGEEAADDDEEVAEDDDDGIVEAADENDEEADGDALTHGDWEQGFDESSQHHYWFNSATEESSWTPPPGWPYDLQGNLLASQTAEDEEDDDGEEDETEEDADASDELSLEARIAMALQGGSAPADDEVDFSDNDSLPDL